MKEQAIHLYLRSLLEMSHKHNEVSAPLYHQDSKEKGYGLRNASEPWGLLQWLALGDVLQE